MGSRKLDERLGQIERLFRTEQNGENSASNWESLLDTLMVLYNECNSPGLRREKNVLEFLEFGKDSNFMLPVYRLCLWYRMFIHLV